MDFDITRLRILVIDDELFMRQLTHRVLDEIGIYQVTAAEDGFDALTKFSTTRKNFDLVICDLEMPNMDGIEFVSRLRHNSKLPNSNVPVLIVTGLSGEDSVLSAIESGIHGYLVKPISKLALENRITAAMTSPPIDPQRLN